jgi:hypothetical protein
MGGDVFGARGASAFVLHISGQRALVVDVAHDHLLRCAIADRVVSAPTIGADRPRRRGP